LLWGDKSDTPVSVTETAVLRLERDAGGGWRLAGPGAGEFALVNDYLGYLADRNYSPRSVRAYGFDLLAFCRWLAGEEISLDAVTTEVVLEFLRACREAALPGRPSGNVVSMTGQRLDRYAVATINHRLAVVAGLFAFRQMRDPDARSPVPKGREARFVTAEERSGLLGHLVRPKHRSALRLREPRRLPRPLDRRETADLLGSLRSWRDRAIAGLMLLCGLRSCEVLAMDVADVDVGARWLRVSGKGGKERRVPLDVDVAGLIQAYLLAERPETDSTRLFVVAKGPHRGQPLTAAGLRTIFRYHRAKAGVPAGHPHALRHTFGTALAEAGVDLAVMQALLGHAHVDTSARYIHLAPVRVKDEFDAARGRIRARS
jgi:integrase/recombinase XerD